MKVNVYQENELTNVWTNQQDIVMQLLGYFTRKSTSKNNNFNIRVKEHYGEDYATITINTWYYDFNNNKNITKLVFEKIPYKYGWLDIYTISKLLENETIERLGK